MLKNEMRRYKRGTARSGKGGKGPEKPRAGDRDRFVKGAQGRQARSQEEVAAVPPGDSCARKWND